LEQQGGNREASAFGHHAQARLFEAEEEPRADPVVHERIATTLLEHLGVARDAALVQAMWEPTGRGDRSGDLGERQLDSVGRRALERRSREHETEQGAGVGEREVQCPDAAQAVAEQHDRQVRRLARHAARHGEHGGDHLVAHHLPRRRVAARARCLTVAGEVQRDHREGAIDQGARQRRIAAAVLAEAMHDRDQRPRPLGAPGAARQLHAAADAHVDTRRWG